MRPTTKQQFIYYVFGADGAVRYVGCSFNPSKRLAQHKRVARAATRRPNALIPPFWRWLVAEEDAGRPVYVCTVKATGSDPEAEEFAEMQRMLDQGAPLLNVFNGTGDRGWTPPPSLPIPPSHSILRDGVIEGMERCGINLNQLAAASGVSYGRLHEWVNGKSASIRSDSLEAIMRAVGLKVSPIGRPPKPRR